MVNPDEVEQDRGLLIDNIIPSYGYQMMPMVGLGGSAGGIQALREFFDTLPPDTGLSFVVVIHLSPDFESTLPDILQRSTKMRVSHAKDGEKVEPNNVYVIPPGKHLTVTDGHLKLSKLEHPHGKRVAVDLFFRSLADSHGAHAAAIVLSGADGDGALGVKRVKERGGLTIAQEPAQAETSSMPLTAINTSMVDWVLPVAEMPRRLIEYFEQEKRVIVPSEEGPEHSPARSAQGEAELVLRDVLIFLRTRTGRDFSYYKRATILRRIARRMQVNGVNDLTEYLNYMRLHTGEAGALLQDMLISVTNFFRDRDAFDALKEHIPALFEGKGPNEAVRVWVPACATGEEAYSLVMLLMEYAATLPAPPSLQIFATDLDEQVIQTARQGVYPETITTDVSEERLKRFFIKVPEGYRVRKEVREAVLFAAHDLLKDSPFSRLDLVSCRNLLIYLNREAQARVFSIFHFALRAGGLMFLGSSESMDEANTLFTLVDKKFRIFAQQSNQRPGQRSALPVPIGPSTLARTFLSTDTSQRSLSIAGRQFESPLDPLRDKSKDEDPRNGASWSEIHFHLIERLGPPSVIVDREYNICHLSENAGRFLKHSGGEPTTNLLSLVHPMLRIELRATLFRASQTGEPAEIQHVPMDDNGRAYEVSLRVSPVGAMAPGYLLVLFEAGESTASERKATVLQTRDAVLANLEKELTHVKTHLRDTIEQYEAGTEELKASNEELQAMNEELRSATEELETGREELQSINEELITVNLELKGSVDDLSHANSDLHNLMSSTDIATIFLDRQLQVMRFTPPAAGLFYLIPSDMGRPLAHLRHQLEYPTLISDAERVLQTLVPMEREVAFPEGWYLARLIPYRTMDDHIAGVVLTFVNITEQKQAQEALGESEERFRGLVNQSVAGIAEIDLSGKFVSVNDRFCEICGHRRAELLTGVKMQDLMHPEDLPDVEEPLQRTISEGIPCQIEKRYVRANGTWVWVHSSISLVHNAAGFPSSLAVVSIDITVRREAEQSLQNSEQRLRIALEAAQLTTWEWNLVTDEVVWNDQNLQIFGQATSSLKLDQFFQRVHAFDQEMVREKLRRAVAENIDFQAIFRAHREDGTIRWMEGYGRIVDFAGGEPTSMSGVMADVTDRKEMEQKIQASNERFHLAEEASNGFIYDWDIARDTVLRSEGFTRILGYAPEDIGDDSQALFGLIHPDDWARLEPQKRQIKKTTSNVSAEYRLRHKLGHYVDVFDRAMVVCDEVGVPVRLVGSTVDVSERKRGEREMLFLSSLGERIRQAEDPAVLLDSVCRSAAAHYGVTHALFARVDTEKGTLEVAHEYHHPDSPACSGALLAEYPAAFTERLAKGLAFIADDVEKHPVTASYFESVFQPKGCRALMAEPVQRDSSWAGALVIYHEQPRHWSEGDRNLLETMTERVWLAVEKLRQEKALRESELRFRSLFTSNMVAMGIWRQDGTIEEANDALLSLLGYTREDVESGVFNWRAITPPEYAPLDEQALAEIVAKGLFVPFEKEYFHRNGTRIPVLVGGSSFRQGAETGIFFCVDLTVRREIEEALRMSNERLRLIIENAREYAIFSMDLDRRVISWNSGAERLLGFTGEEILGVSGDIIFTPEDVEADMPQKEADTAVREGRAVDERWHVRKNGERFWGSGVMMSMGDSHGTQIGFVKIFRDQTDARLTEEARRQAEERFRLLVDSVQDYAIFLLDAKGHITSWNQGATRIKGYNEDEVMGRHFSIFYPANAVEDKLPEREMETARTNGRSEDESWRVRKNGEHFWVNEIMIPLNDGSGGFAKISRDLTERKMFEVELTKHLVAEQTARQEAEAAGKAKDNFLAVLSHELRTPLTPILMAVHGLAKSKNLPPLAAESLKMIQRNIMLEARLIDDLLDL
ncbi:MAG TPA: PAS domain S-box protein, partial [Chthoniobacteraceae bacterium]